MAPLLLLLLLTLPPAYEDRTEPLRERQDRLEVLGRAVARATDELVADKSWTLPAVDLALLLVTLGEAESRFARHVHAGRCRKNFFVGRGIRECDAGRAATPWQLWITPQVPRALWKRLPGLDQAATDLAAFTAGRVLSYHVRGCGSYEGGIARYATGRVCRWSRAPKRFARFVELRRRYELLRAASHPRKSRIADAISSRSDVTADKGRAPTSGRVPAKNTE